MGQSERGLQLRIGSLAGPARELRFQFGRVAHLVSHQARRGTGGNELVGSEIAVLKNFLQMLQCQCPRGVFLRAGVHGLRVIHHHDQRAGGAGHLPARSGGGQHEEQEHKQFEKEDQRQLRFLNAPSAFPGFLMHLPEEQRADGLFAEAMAQEINRSQRGQGNRRDPGQGISEEWHQAGSRALISSRRWSELSICSATRVTSWAPVWRAASCQLCCRRLRVWRYCCCIEASM